MVEYVTTLRLAGYALGSLGGLLVFVEFFMQPSYVEYDKEFGSYDIEMSPRQVVEHTWFGRLGAMCIALAFALQLFTAFVS